MPEISSVVTIENATLTGVTRADGGCEFRGIRFATAARFTDPVDNTPSGQVDATTYGPICHQTPGFLEQTLGLDSSSMSEDCLSLNIYVPPHTHEDDNLPVLFWIHGGAYTNGAGSLAWYHGSNLASRKCIVVAINYRLGIFGFTGTQNLGVKDMVSALRWTNKFIANFGGNPGNVTIFGESAGGSAVVSLMATPQANELFHKAWAMSPSIGQLRTKDRAEKIQETILSVSECADLESLSHLSAERLLEVQNVVLGQTSKEFDWFAPTDGTDTIPASILETAAASHKPFVIGTNRDENKLWAAFDPTGSNKTDVDWKEHLGRVFPGREDDACRIYEARRAGESPHFLMSAVNTDIAFRARAWSLIDRRLKHNVPSWMYWFTWQTPAFGGILGSCHALDIPFAFDNLDAPGGELFTGDSPDRIALAQRFADEIVHFATHGHPTWSQYDDEMRNTLQLDTEVSLVSDPESDVRQLFTAK
jgi:para-nitrobenzyl esterase